MGINPITRNMMEIEVGKKYNLICNSAPHQTTWWVNPKSREKVKVISKSVAPFSVAATATVEVKNEEHRSTISSFADSENCVVILEKNIGANVSVVDKWVRSNVDIQKLKDSGFIRSGRSETRIVSPFKLQEVGVEEELELDDFSARIKQIYDERQE